MTGDLKETLKNTEKLPTAPMHADALSGKAMSAFLEKGPVTSYPSDGSTPVAGKPLGRIKGAVMDTLGVFGYAIGKTGIPPKSSNNR